MTDTADTAEVVELEQLLTQWKIEEADKERFLKLMRKLAEKNTIAIKTIKNVLDKILSNHSMKIEKLQDEIKHLTAQLESLPVSDTAQLETRDTLTEGDANPDHLAAQLAEARAKIERLETQLAERPSTETHADSAQLADLTAQLAEALAEIERLKAQPHTQHEPAATHTEASDRRVLASGLLAVKSCCELPHPNTNPSFDDVCQTIRETPPSKLIGVSYTAASVRYQKSPISQTGEIMFRDCLPHFKGILYTLHKTHIDPNVVKLGPFFKNHTNDSIQIKCCIVRLLRAVQNRTETEAVVTPEQPLPLALTN